MQNILHSKHYNIGKYLVQIRSQARSSGISLPEAHGRGKGLDPNVLPEKQVIKPIITSEAKGIAPIKPMLGQGTAGLRQKCKPPMTPPINKPIVKLTEKPIPHPENIDQPKITLKVPIPLSEYVIPQGRSRDDSSSRIVKRKTIQDISREIPMCLDPIYRPAPKPVEIHLQEVPRNLLYLDTDINMDFKKIHLIKRV